MKVFIWLTDKHLFQISVKLNFTSKIDDCIHPSVLWSFQTEMTDICLMDII